LSCVVIVNEWYIVWAIIIYNSWILEKKWYKNVFIVSCSKKMNNREGSIKRTVKIFMLTYNRSARRMKNLRIEESWHKKTNIFVWHDPNWSKSSLMNLKIKNFIRGKTFDCFYSYFIFNIFTLILFSNFDSNINTFWTE